MLMKVSEWWNLRLSCCSWSRVSLFIRTFWFSSHVQYNFSKRNPNCVTFSLHAGFKWISVADKNFGKLWLFGVSQGFLQICILLCWESQAILPNPGALTPLLISAGVSTHRHCTFPGKHTLICSFWKKTLVVFTTTLTGPQIQRWSYSRCSYVQTVQIPSHVLEYKLWIIFP